MKRRVVKRHYARAIRNGIRRARRIRDSHNRLQHKRKISWMLVANSLYGKTAGGSIEAASHYSLASISGRYPMLEDLSSDSGRCPKADTR